MLANCKILKGQCQLFKFKQNIKTISSTKTGIALHEFLDCVSGKNWFLKITLKDPFKELCLNFKNLIYNNEKNVH